MGIFVLSTRPAPSGSYSFSVSPFTAAIRFLQLCFRLAETVRWLCFVFYSSVAVLVSFRRHIYLFIFIGELFWCARVSLVRPTLTLKVEEPIPASVNTKPKKVLQPQQRHRQNNRNSPRKSRPSRPFSFQLIKMIYAV